MNEKEATQCSVIALTPKHHAHETTCNSNKFHCSVAWMEKNTLKRHQTPQYGWENKGEDCQLIHACYIFLLQATVLLFVPWRVTVFSRLLILF